MSDLLDNLELILVQLLKVLTPELRLADRFDGARYLCSLDRAGVYLTERATTDELCEFIILSNVLNLLEFHLSLEGKNVTLHVDTFLPALPLVELETHVVLQLIVVAEQPMEVILFFFISCSLVLLLLFLEHVDKGVKRALWRQMLLRGCARLDFFPASIAIEKALQETWRLLLCLVCK